MDKDKNIEKDNLDELSKEEVTKQETSQEEAPKEEVAAEEAPKEEVVAEEATQEDMPYLPFGIGKKVGMTQIFSDDGSVYPTTLVEFGPCYITQIKTLDKDGYTSVQLGFMDVKKDKTTKALSGHFAKSKVSPKRYVKEFLYTNINDISLGQEVSISQFEPGDFLNVTGKSIGKGFAGHMKRHNFGGGRRSHGKNSVMRKAGSVGAGTDPGKVWKGTRMAGRMGGDKVTVKNLEVLKIDKNNNIMFIKGSIPGPNNRIVYINKI